MAQLKDIEIWLEKQPFEDTNLQMLNDNVLNDVTFLVGEVREEIKAHRFMLASRSPVFHAMFCGPMSETSGDIEIVDIEPDTMKTLLRFIYTEDCVVTGDSVMALLYGAKKYNIRRLEEKCRTFLSKQISCETACDIFAQAHLFNETELKQECFTFILLNGRDVFKSNSFSTIPSDLLKEILESDNILANELDIYEGCKQWAAYQLGKADEKNVASPSEIRNVLGELMYLIRFPTMPIATFTKISYNDILSPEEKINIFQIIGGHSKAEGFKFNDKIRQSSNITTDTKLNRIDFKGILNTPGGDSLILSVTDRRFKNEIKKMYMTVLSINIS